MPAAAAAGFRLEGVVHFERGSDPLTDLEVEVAGERLVVSLHGKSSPTAFQSAGRLARGTAYDVQVVRHPVFMHGGLYERGRLACTARAGARGVIGDCWSVPYPANP